MEKKKAAVRQKEKGRCTDRKRNVCERHPGIPETPGKRGSV